MLRTQALPRGFVLLTGLAVANDGRFGLGLIDGRLAFCFTERGFYFVPARHLVSSLRGNRSRDDGGDHTNRL